MSTTIIVAGTPTDAQRQAILEPLQAHNTGMAGPYVAVPLTIMLRDNASNMDVGGLLGRSVYNWLYIELLALPEHMRGKGHGSALMRAAEDVARARGCVGIHLRTFESQARGFYEKLGYECYGTLDDHPIGFKDFAMRKVLRLR